MIDIDPFMADAVKRDTIPDFASPSDHFTTAGGLQWACAPWRLRSGHVVDFKGATLELDLSRVPDEMLRAEQPITFFAAQNRNIYGKTGEDAWAALLSELRVENVRLVANFSKLQPRAKALGVSLRISAGGLIGHGPQWDNIELSDFGAYRANPDVGAECFPIWTAGADDGYDRNALSTVDPRHTFSENTRPASITRVRFVDYHPEFSNDQVTVRMCVGATCNDRISESPWGELGGWHQIMQREAILTDNVTGTDDAPIKTPNIVQCLTAYQTLKATVGGNSSRGASIGYYSDYLRNRGVHIRSDNSFRGGIWGAVVRLSPTAGDSPQLAEQFSAEDFVIEKFDCDASAGDVYVNADLPNTAQRYIRNIAIDERLRVQNDGDRAGVVRIPAPDTKRKGCRWA